jgi:hypothetical protein
MMPVKENDRVNQEIPGLPGLNNVLNKKLRRLSITLLIGRLTAI